MKLIRRSKARLVFHLGQREGSLLLQVLKLYPRMPSAHQKLSKAGRLPDPEANQRLLDEALAEQRAENRKQLQALLADPRRFAQTETGWPALAFTRRRRMAPAGAQRHPGRELGSARLARKKDVD